MSNLPIGSSPIMESNLDYQQISITLTFPNGEKTIISHRQWKIQIASPAQGRFSPSHWPQPTRPIAKRGVSALPPMGEVTPLAPWKNKKKQNN